MLLLHEFFFIYIRYQCKENPRTKGMASIDELYDDGDLFFMDLRKQCLR